PPRARRPGGGGHHSGRALAGTAQSRRGLPGSDRRLDGRQAVQHERRGGVRMSAVTEEPAAEARDEGVLSTSAMADVLEPVRRRRPSGLSTSLTFGGRALLKIKHSPEQLFDVTAFPIIMTVMFTYLFGGALAGTPEQYLDY